MPRGRSPHRTTAHLLFALLLLAGAAACGDDDDTQTATDGGSDVAEPAEEAPLGAGGGAAGTCLEGTPDCQDTPMGDDEPVMGPDGEPVPTDPDGDEFPTDAARQEAQALLGTPEADLPPDVRIGRRGEETFALTEDYVLGRITVELDDDGSGTHVVTSATVELPDGPETFEA